jgi:hypothetical protein
MRAAFSPANSIVALTADKGDWGPSLESAMLRRIYASHTIIAWGDRHRDDETQALSYQCTQSALLEIGTPVDLSKPQ